MRIIAGQLKNKRLFSVPGQITRPTADRLRESLFNILSPDVHGAQVLDLFAGTGALGIEAMSRGARGAVFVDRRKAAVRVIERNITSCSLQRQCRVIQWDVLRNLNCLQAIAPRFTLVFMDPPYETGAVGPALVHLRDSRSLAADARIVVEHSRREPLMIGDESAFRLDDQRRYGKSIVSFLKFLLL
jgi:16S rRNA (guanine966-N2)-methyltransferase